MGINPPATPKIAAETNIQNKEFRAFTASLPFGQDSAGVVARGVILAPRDGRKSVSSELVAGASRASKWVA